MLLSVFRIIIRSVLFTLHLITAVVICTLMPLIDGKKWHQYNRGRNLISWWSKSVFYIFGIKVIATGKIKHPDCLLVSNHISFLDIVIISSFHPAIFLSKDTLLNWPIIGFMAKRSGTIFIKRGKKSELKTVMKKIQTALKDDQSVIIFPEGTTTSGQSVKNFHSGFLQAAINTNKHVQPVTIRYVRDGRADRIAAYVENDNFIINLIKLMAQKSTHAEINFSYALKSNNMNRMELATTCHHIVRRTIEDRL